MGWWGKLAGGAFGFMLGGPLGALLGAAIGHNFDQGMAAQEHLAPGDQERVQAAFFTATFSVMGYIAKADGRVSEDEIIMARRVMDEMQLNTDQRRLAMDLFTRGKQPGFPFEDTLQQFRQEAHRRQTLVQMFLELQLHAAYADGIMHPGERAIIEQACRLLGFPLQALAQLEAMVRHQHNFTGSAAPRGDVVAEAYAVLGVSPQASDADIKRAYRRLMNQHHPDKLVAKGLPEEMMRMATDKTHEIRQAYELLMKSRGR